MASLPRTSRKRRSPDDRNRDEDEPPAVVQRTVYTSDTSREDVLSEIEGLESRFCISAGAVSRLQGGSFAERAGKMVETSIKRLCEAAGVREDSSPQAINDALIKAVEEFRAVYGKVVHSSGYDRAEMGDRLGFIGTTAHTAFDMARNALVLNSAVVKSSTGAHNAVTAMPLVPVPTFNVPETTDTDLLAGDDSDVESLRVQTLNMITQKGLRRVGDDLYEQVTSDGIGTYSWKPKVSIDAFVEGSFGMDTYAKQAVVLNRRGVAAHIKDRVRRCGDTSLISTVKKSRSMLSFRNGVLNVRDEVPTEGALPGGRPDVRVRFMPYVEDQVRFPGLETAESVLGSTSVSTAKYIDRDLPPEAVACRDWRDVRTPIIQGVLDHQGIDREASDWIYALMGRALFNTGDLEGWQVMVFFHGVAGTGKGTILRVIKDFYEDVDVGTIGNQIETRFGLEDLKDKWVIIGMEVGANFKMDQKDFQSIVSGEDVSVREKNKVAKPVVWKSHMFLAGNRMFNYNDDSQSITRRVIVVNFANHVPAAEKNPNLDKELCAELPSIMYKCARAYVEMARRYGSVDVMSVLPPFFKESQRAVFQQLCTLMAFLQNCSGMVMSPELEISYDDFLAAYDGYCRTSKKKPRQVDDTFKVSMHNYGLRLEDRENNHKVVVGCSIFNHGQTSTFA